MTASRRRRAKQQLITKANTHTHTQTHTHKHTHKHTNTYFYAHARRARTHTHTHAHTNRNIVLGAVHDGLDLAPQIHGPVHVHVQPEDLRGSKSSDFEWFQMVGASRSQDIHTPRYGVYICEHANTIANFQSFR